ncbi:hypothetical protein AKO1_005119, partial [Acrasis kona]
MIRQTKLNLGIFGCPLFIWQGQPLVDWITDNVRLRWFATAFITSFVLSITTAFFFTKEWSHVFSNPTTWVTLIVSAPILFVNNPRSNIFTVFCACIYMLFVPLSLYEMVVSITNMNTLNKVSLEAVGRANEITDFLLPIPIGDSHLNVTYYNNTELLGILGNMTENLEPVAVQLYNGVYILHGLYTSVLHSFFDL